MEGERFPQKPIDTHPLEVGSFFGGVEVSVEEEKDTPEMKQIAGYLEDINETAVRNIVLQELRKSLDTTQVIRRMGRFIPKSKIEIEEGDDSDDYLGIYYGDKSIALNAHLLAQSSSRASIGLHNKIASEADEVDTALYETYVRGKSVPRIVFDLVLNTDGVRDSLRSELNVRSLQEDKGKILAHFDEIAGWLNVVLTFVHEELHAITDTGKQNTTYTLSNTARFQRAVGLQTETDQHIETRRESDDATVVEHYRIEKGRGINEAITQLISLRMTRMYLKQCPRNTFEQKYANDILQETKVGYSNEMRVAEQYIALISTLSNVPEDVILNGIFKEYVENGTYLPDMFISLLEEHMPHLGFEGWTALGKELHTQLSADSFPENSGFYEALSDLIMQLPPQKRDGVYEKLTALNIKYFGDPESVSAAEIDPPIAHY
tara:strand:- start:126 stop:1427 length:1302 start_codon:yes stop_codon:yes gene_type:complete